MPILFDDVTICVKGRHITTSSGSFLRVPPVALKMHPYTVVGFSNELSTCLTIFKLENVLSQTQQQGTLLVTCVRGFMYS